MSWAECGRTISVGQTFGRARQTSKVPTACLWGVPFSNKGRPIHETTTKYGLVRIGPKSHFFFLCCDAFGLATTLYYLFYPEHVTRPRASHEGFWRGHLRWGDGWTGWHHVFSGSLLSRPSRPELLVPAVPEGQRPSCSSGAEERAFDVGVGFLWCGASEHAVPHRTRHHARARRTCRANGCYSCQGFHGYGYKCQGKTRSGWSSKIPFWRVTYHSPIRNNLLYIGK